MGGNALKNTATERKLKADYEIILKRVTDCLAETLPNVRVAEIKAYANKESFGDADILVESDNLPANWTNIIKEKLQPSEWVNNNVVQSFDVDKLQIDLILVPGDSFEFANHYFNYNDLGNLMGRIAHKMGFKYGHLGLFAPLRDDSHQYAEVAITKNSQEAMQFLGYDYKRYEEGFKDMDDIFTFAASSHLIHRDIFLLDNRNAKARVRDAKRPTYTAFLKWIESRPELDKHKWPEDNEEKLKIKQEWLKSAAMKFPNFKKQLSIELAELAERKLMRQVWNGELVSRWTGLSGEELGIVMKACKEKKENFNEWVMKSSANEREKYAQECAKGVSCLKLVAKKQH